MTMQKLVGRGYILICPEGMVPEMKEGGDPVAYGKKAAKGGLVKSPASPGLAKAPKKGK